MAGAVSDQVGSQVSAGGASGDVSWGGGGGRVRVLGLGKVMANGLMGKGGGEGDKSVRVSVRV